MSVIELSAPFGEIFLEIAEAEAAFDDPAIVALPALPEGMRVNECKLLTGFLECGAGDAFTVRLRLQPSEGWVTDFASGEDLDAFELKNPGNAVGTVAMRDPEWFCRRFPLVVVEASNGKAGNNLLTAKYKALVKTRVNIEAAYAWTDRPTTEREAGSPWFAVDQAMTL